jgi:hypothetical protein
VTALETIRDDLISECQEDFVGIWSVLWQVKNRIGTQDPVELQRLTLELIREILETRTVQAGTFAPGGQQFRSWNVPPEQAVDTIKQQWDALGREPNIGDIAFLPAVNSAVKCASL